MEKEEDYTKMKECCYLVEIMSYKDNKHIISLPACAAGDNQYGVIEKESHYYPLESLNCFITVLTLERDGMHCGFVIEV